MIDDYIKGSTAQLIERARCLVSLIPRDLPRSYDSLTQRCRGDLKQVLAELRHIAEDLQLNRPENGSIRVRAFKRAVADLDFIETTGIAALSRSHQDDHRLNDLVARITSEIRYPLPAPCCTSLSRNYFYINPHLNLLFVPLAESHFLLHLPDIYHELAHPLLSAQDDPIIEPLQQNYNAALASCLTKVREELLRLERGRHPEGAKAAYRTWESCWVRGWLVEFFCDLFAVFTVGPAFAWSHLHLTLKRGTDPFGIPRYIPSSHPADDARMRAILHGLTLIGFSSSADDILRKWQSSVCSLGYPLPAEYNLCFPEELIMTIVQLALDGTRALSVEIYRQENRSSVACTLNDAWSAFWIDSSKFVAAEKTLVSSLSPGNSTKPQSGARRFS